MITTLYKFYATDMDIIDLTNSRGWIGLFSDGMMWNISQVAGPGWFAMNRRKIINAQTCCLAILICLTNSRKRIGVMTLVILSWINWVHALRNTVPHASTVDSWSLLILVDSKSCSCVLYWKIFRIQCWVTNKSANFLYHQQWGSLIGCCALLNHTLLPNAGNTMTQFTQGVKRHEGSLKYPNSHVAPTWTVHTF